MTLNKSFNSFWALTAVLLSRAELQRAMRYSMGIVFVHCQWVRTGTFLLRVHILRTDMWNDRVRQQFGCGCSGAGPLVTVFSMFHMKYSPTCDDDGPTPERFGLTCNKFTICSTVAA